METPKRTGFSGLAFLPVIIIAFVGAIVWFVFIGPGMRQDRLEKEGIRMKGVLMKAEETGTVVNDHPEYELTVAIQRPNGKIDTAETTYIPSITEAALLQQGVNVMVAVDSTDPKDFTIVAVERMQYGGAPAANSPNMDSLNAMMKQLQDSMQAMSKRLNQK